MATKLDLNFANGVKEGVQALIYEIQRLEGQVDAYERACTAILNTIETHGKLWGVNRGTSNPSIGPQEEILRAVRGLIEQAARNVPTINEDQP